MKKNIKIIAIFILLITITSCGFKKINSKDVILINIVNINITGEQRIAYYLKNDILLISNNDSNEKYTLDIKLKKMKNTKIKDTTGKTTRYNVSINASLQLTNQADNKKINRNFLQSLDYDVAKVHSDTIKNEKNAVKNITQTIADDIVSFITLMNRK